MINKGLLIITYIFATIMTACFLSSVHIIDIKNQHIKAQDSLIASKDSLITQLRFYHTSALELNDLIDECNRCKRKKQLFQND